MYTTVFYKTQKQFNAALNRGKKNNTVEKNFSPLLSITYKENVIVNRTASIDKIIQFSHATGVYTSGFDSFSTKMNKIYISNSQENWLTSQIYQELISRQLDISGYTQDDVFSGTVKILSGSAVSSDTGTLKYEGDDKIVANMAYFKFDLGSSIPIPTGYIVLMINDISDYDEALKYLINNKFGYKNYLRLFKTFIINVPASLLRSKTIFQIKNDFDNLSFTKYCIVDFLFEVELNYQIPYESPYHWYLQNIKSREAWLLMDWVSGNTTNSEPVEVAMIDSVVDIDHPELIGKISQHSFNATSFYNENINYYSYGLNVTLVNNCPNPPLQFAHGTGTAGLLAASNSNNDLMYSASNDKVKIQVIALGTVVGSSEGNCVPINPFFGISVLAQIFDRIMENPKCVSIVTTFTFSPAGTNWGYSGEYLQEIITFTTTQGRNGKGIPFFASSGNANLSSVNPPGNFNNVYSVGASSIYNNKAGFSTYGEDLFICAPGEQILSLSPTGHYGNSLNIPYVIPVIADKRPKNLRDIIITNESLQVSFGGTSSSAPIVAAVAATMIWLNPSLTKTQVINILAETARKVGVDNEGNPYQYINGKSLELGYGIIDHEQAIYETIQLIQTEFEPWEDPIEIQITNVPAGALFGDVIEISYQITLDGSISADTEYITAQIFIEQENGVNNWQLLSQFTYTEFSVVTTFTENIQIPVTPFGETPNKNIKITATAYDELLNNLSYGFSYDTSIIDISLNGGLVPLINIQITFLGIECLQTGIPCNQIDGHAFKLRVKNLSNAGVNILAFAVRQTEVLHVTNVSLTEFYTGVTQNDFGYTSEIYIEPQQEVIVLGRPNYLSWNPFDISQCFFITTTYVEVPEQLYDESGLSYPTFYLNYPNNYFSSGWYKITSWPSSYTICTPTIPPIIN